MESSVEIEDKYQPVLLSRIKTPDGTILTSWHRHDYKSHDDANGEQYMIDGGTAYFRSWVNSVPAENLSQSYKPDDHEHNRQYSYWGTYGKNGDQPLKYVFVKDMETEHIEAVLETQIHITPYTKKIMEEELKYRNKDGNDWR